MDICLLNGQPSQLELSHRGLAFGDGVFETIKIRNQRLVQLEQHFARLEKGINVLELAWSKSQSNHLKQVLEEYSSKIQDPHVCKIMLLRKQTGRGYGYDAQAQETDVIIQISPYVAPLWVHSGADISLSTSNISENETLAGVKHLNRLDSVLAKSFATRNQLSEALMADSSGNIIEGSMSNVFFKIEGKWLTPLLSTAGVSGTVRAQILEKYPAVDECNIPLNQLNEIESAFICNSLIGVVNVLSLENRPLKTDPFVQQLNKENSDSW